MLARTKTDATDARRIARFCEAHQVVPWTPAPLIYQQLRALVHVCMTASNVLALYAREAGTFEAVAEKPFDIDALIGLIKGSLGFGPSEQ